MRSKLETARQGMVAFADKVGSGMKSAYGKVSAGAAGLGASALAMAEPTSPGAAIAGELSSGKADVMLVVAAVAIILGALILWAYVKRAR